ncbi:MAG TPA: hypothetical protein VJB63_02840, partial [Patescibacteria group bacterium]|nr:hypothetical protein [Patescibacteria group bacterium]
DCGETWGFYGTGNLCTKSNNNHFEITITNPSGTVVFTQNKASVGGNGNVSYSVETTNHNITTAGTYTVKICPSNGSPLLGQCYTNTFVKKKIPSATITGQLIEHFNYVLLSGSYCALPGVSSGVQLQLIRQYPTTPGLPSSLDCQTSGLIQVDGISKITNYTCTVDYNNITVDIPTIDNYQGSIDYLNQTFSLQLKQPVAGYSEYYCPRTNNNNNYCNQKDLDNLEKCTNNNSIEFSISGPPPKNEFDLNDTSDPVTSQTINVLFDILNSGANASNYYKLKNIQYRRSGSATADIFSPIPANPLPYDSDDNGGFYFLTGQQGSPLTSPFDQPTTTLGSGIFYGSLNIGSAEFSFKNWKKSFQSSFKFTPAILLELIKSRKKYITKNAVPVDFNEGDIYIINATSTVTIQDNQVNQEKKIIIVNGADLKLTPNGSSTTFNSPNKSLLFMSTGTVRFDAQIEEANGIFMGNNIDLGTTDDAELKIKGNLISVNPVNTNPLSRKRFDNQRPSLFVIFDAKPYIDLLPYLSTTSYQWNELVP